MRREDIRPPPPKMAVQKFSDTLNYCKFLLITNLKVNDLHCFLTDKISALLELFPQLIIL